MVRRNGLFFSFFREDRFCWIYGPKQADRRQGSLPIVIRAAFVFRDHRPIWAADARRLRRTIRGAVKITLQLGSRLTSDTACSVLSESSRIVSPPSRLVRHVDCQLRATRAQYRRHQTRPDVLTDEVVGISRYGAFIMNFATVAQFRSRADTAILLSGSG